MRFLSKIRRPSPAMVVAMIALFVALGGGAYAATSLPENSVGSKQVKRNSLNWRDICCLRHTDITNNTLLGRDIHDGTLEYKDFAELPSARVYYVGEASQTVQPGGDDPEAGGGYKVKYNMERWDTHKLHSNSTNNTRLTAPYSGVYEITCNVWWAANDAAGGHATYILYMNTYKIGGVYDMSVPQGHAQEVTTLSYLKKNDYVECYVHWNGPGTTSIMQKDRYSPEFMMHWVSPYFPADEEEEEENGAP